MKATEYAKAKIKIFEGCRLHSYRDMAGVLTIGYGHTAGVKEKQTISNKQADLYFEQDLKITEAALAMLPIAATLSQNQWDALVSWCFNLGVGRLTHGSDGKPTTLYKKIAAKAPDSEIQAQFKRWIYAGGKVAKGLVRRRAWEAERWAAASV